MTQCITGLTILLLALAASGCELFLDFDTGESGQQCTDGVDNDGDGLLDCADPSCTCAGQACGNGQQDGVEACDDGGNELGDGCGPACTIEPGWSCEGFPSVCTMGNPCSNPLACPADSVCRDAPGAPNGFTCECGPGFTGTPGACDDLDECATGGDVCAAEAICTNTYGSYTCLCGASSGGDGFECSPVLFLTRTPQKLNSAHAGCSTDFSSTARKAATDGLSHLYAAFTCGGQVVVAASADLGSSWSEVEVPIADAVEVAIQGRGGAGSFVAAITTTGDLVVSFSDDVGQTWSAPETLGSGFDPTVGIAMASTQSGLYVAAYGGGMVRVFDRADPVPTPWQSQAIVLTPTAFDLLVDSFRYDAYLVGEDGSGAFAAVGLRSRLGPDIAFTTIVRPADSHGDPDWTWGNGRIFAAGSSGANVNVVSRYDVPKDAAAPTAIGEVPKPVAKQRAVAADLVGNLYMASAIVGSTENDLELHFVRAGADQLTFSRALGPGHSPHVTGLPTQDGALVVFTVGTDVFAAVEMAPETSCQGYLGARNRGSGAYVIDPDDKGGQPAYGALCDQTTDGGGWTMVHKLSTNVASSPQQAWFEMVAFPGSDLAALDTGPETAHYTNSIPTFQWNINASYVSLARVAVYTGGVENAFLHFVVPPMSDNSSWFAKANLTAASWSDLVTTATPDFFDISGDGEHGHSWQITQNTSTCQLAAGWLVVDSGPNLCAWEDKFPSDVSILYADPTVTPVVAELESSGRIKEADTLIVWVR